MEVSGQLHAPAALPQGKSLWYPLHRWLGGPQSQLGCSSVEINSQPQSGPKLPIIQLIAQHYITELSWLLNNEILPSNKL